MPKATKTNKRMKLVIDRKRWKRGGKDGIDAHDPTCLLTESGQMCCLGFLARARGYKCSEIRLEGDLESLIDTSERRSIDRACEAFPTLIKPNGSANNLHSKLIGANDDEAPAMRGKPREEKLKKLFAEAGIDVVFK